MNEPPPQNTWQKSPAPPPVAKPPAVPQPANRPPMSKGTKLVLGILGSVAGIVVLLIVVYVAALATPPRIVTPKRSPVPRQNGFELLKAATEKPVRLEDVGDAIAVSPKKKWTLAEKRNLVEANKGSIAATRRAIAVSYLEQNRAVSMNDEFPYYKKFRHMARVLVLAGNVAWEEGRQMEAADYYLDAVTIGRRVPHQTPLLGRLVGIACEAIGRRAIWRHLEQMDAKTAAHCLARLQALQSELLPYHVTLEEEKYSMTHMVLEGMQDPDQFLSMGDEEPTKEDKEENPRRAFRIYSTVMPRKVVTDMLGAHMDKLIAQSKKPYIEGNEELPLPSELYTRIVVPPVLKARLRYVANETGDALLRTALALRIYKARNGKYPADLSELVTSKLLPAVPGDSFDMPGAPIHYELPSNGKYLLYSIGPDGSDDGGKGIERKSAKSALSRTVELDSKGDMVAGWHWY